MVEKLRKMFAGLLLNRQKQRLHTENAAKETNTPPQEPHASTGFLATAGLLGNVKSKKCGKEQHTPVTCLTEKVNTFLLGNYDFRYNVLTEETEFRPTDGHGCAFRPIGKRELNTFCMEAHTQGIACWDKDVSRYIYSTCVAEYHPFKLYMEELPAWDGIDRLAELARRVSDTPIWV